MFKRKKEAVPAVIAQEPIEQKQPEPAKATEDTSGDADKADAKAKKDPSEITIVAAGVKMRGDIEMAGEVRVYGTFEGTVNCRHLLVAEGGNMIGDVRCEAAKVNGVFDGTMQADSVIAAKTAILIGTFHADRYGIEPGAKMRGTFDEKATQKHEKTIEGRAYDVTGVVFDRARQPTFTEVERKEAARA